MNSEVASVSETVDSTNPIFVSVIIPVFNDAERLKLCLAALGQQTYGQSHFEIIVIDNGSEYPALIEATVEPYDNVTLALEPTPGSYAARNKGLSLAKGDVIAFTDADCIPTPNWIEQGVSALVKVPNCGLVAGKIEIFFKNPERLTPVELYESKMALPQKEFLEKHQYGATANVFTFKRVIEQVGTFDANLKSSGDVEWGQRVAAFGYRQVYSETARICHPARHSFSQLYKRTLRHAGGHYDLQQKQSASFFHRNQLFLQSLIQDLTPPFMFTVAVFRDPTLKNWQQKLSVSLVMFYIRYVTAWEKLRLKLGAVSARE